MSARIPSRNGRALGVMLAGLCLVAASAHGQVLRCTDARTGAIAYTDGSCDSGRQAEQVLPARSPEALAREREEAAQAIARKEQRLREEAETAALTPAAPPPAPVASNDNARCAQSRQQLQSLLNRPGRSSSPAYGDQLAAARQQMELDCLGPQAYGELEQARSQSAVPSAPVIVMPPLRPARPLPPPVQPPRPQITHCNVFRCYDRSGNTYPR